MIMNKEEERAGAALDDELTESLRMWDLVDADEALAEHDWESASRIKCFNDNRCWGPSTNKEVEIQDQSPTKDSRVRFAVGEEV